MDALSQFLESIGYMICFISAVFLIFWLTGSVSVSSDYMMDKRMDKINVYPVEGTSDRPILSEAEVWSEIQASEFVTITVNGTDLTDETLQLVKTYATNPEAIGIAEGSYKKSYAIDGSGKISRIIYTLR